MKIFMEIVDRHRRGLMVLWGIFTILVFSQYIYRYLQQDPYTFQVAWEYVGGFTRYMIAPWLVTALLSVCAYIVGRIAIRSLAKGIRFRNDLEESIYCISIGLGLISIVTFILGLAKLLYPFIFGFLGIVILTAGFRHLIHLFRVIRQSSRPPDWDILDFSLFFLLGAFVLYTFFRPNNPSIGWDAMNSHLVAPKYYLRENAVTFYTWIKFNSFPQLQEMLLTLQMMFFRDPGSSLIYLYMLGSAALTYLIGTRYFNSRTGLVAAAFFLLIPEVYRDSQACYVEHVLIFYCILVVHAFLAWYESRDTRWLVLLGIAGGISCGVKYLGATISLLALILIALAHFIPLPKWEFDLLPQPPPPEDTESPADGGQPAGKTAKKKTRKKKALKKKLAARKLRSKRTKVKDTDQVEPSGDVEDSSAISETSLDEDNDLESSSNGLAKSLGIALLWIVIIASPWYLKNIVQFGNPFFPFFESIFGDLGLGTLNSLRGDLSIDHAEMLKYFRFDLSIRNLAALPWNTTFHHDHPSFYYAPSTVGPFLLAFTPAVLFVRKWRRAGIMLIIFMVLYYGYWFLLERIEYQRYLMSVYPIHALIAAWGLCDLFRLEGFNQRNRAHLAWLMIAVALGFMFFVKTTMRGAFTGRRLAFAGEEARIEYLRNTFGGWDVIEAINTHIEEESALFNEDTMVYGLATENRRFYLDCPLTGDLWTYANHFDFMANADTGEELYEWLRSYNCEFVLYSEGGGNSMSYILDIHMPDDETFTEYFEELATWYDYHLYRLVAPGEARTGPMAGGPPEPEERPGEFEAPEDEEEYEEQPEIMEAPQ